MAWKEMKEKYPNEWLLITDFELDEHGEVKEGVIQSHSPEMDEVAKIPPLHKDTAFRYTGESTFRGFRDHVARGYNV